MQKVRKRPSWPRIGVDWSALSVGETKPYAGTVDGIKNNVSRANRVYKPARFTWFRTTDDRLYVERVK